MGPFSSWHRSSSFHSRLRRLSASSVFKFRRRNKNKIKLYCLNVSCSFKIEITNKEEEIEALLAQMSGRKENN